MIQEQEEWRPIANYPGYEVSSMGRVRSLDRVVQTKRGNGQFWRGKLRKPSLSADGYLTVCLKGKTHHVHRLVADAFISPTLVVNHKDSDQQNNQLSNLEVCTYSANSLHTVAQGRARNSRISDEQRTNIKVLRETGLKYFAIGLIAGVSNSTVRRVLAA
jgi:hypothetical protein